MDAIDDLQGTDVHQGIINEQNSEVNQQRNVTSSGIPKNKSEENNDKTAHGEYKGNEISDKDTRQTTGKHNAENSSGTGSTEANLRVFDPTSKPKWEFAEDELDDNKQYVDLKRVSVVYRGGWGARKPKSSEPLALPVTAMLYLATGTPECKTTEECSQQVMELQRTHMDVLGMPDIQYNFLIGGDGNIYEGRGWYTNPTKDEKNSYLEGKTYDVGFIGQVTDPKEQHPWVAKPLATLLHDAMIKRVITDVIDIYPIQQDRLPRDEKGRPVPVKADMLRLFKVAREPMKDEKKDENSNKLGEYPHL